MTQRLLHRLLRENTELGGHLYERCEVNVQTSNEASIKQSQKSSSTTQIAVVESFLITIYDGFGSAPSINLKTEYVLHSFFHGWPLRIKWMQQTHFQFLI